MCLITVSKNTYVFLVNSELSCIIELVTRHFYLYLPKTLISSHVKLRKYFQANEFAHVFKVFFIRLKCVLLFLYYLSS